MDKQVFQKEYFPLIDIGRFFAAVSVLCFHYFSATAKGLEDGVLKIFIEHGFMGVQLFFMISGFVIYFSLQGSIKKYIVGRFIRIYPLFWFCCTVTYLVTVLFGKSHLPFTTYLYNLLIINTGKTAFMIDGSYWTLTHEIFFYLYIGAFVYIFGKRYIEYFFYLWLTVLSVGVFLGLQHMVLYKVLLIRSGYYFIFGGLLAILYSSRKQIVVWYRTAARITAILVAACMPIYLSVVLRADTQPITNRFGMYDRLEIYILCMLYIFMSVLVFVSEKLYDKKFAKLAIIAGGMTYPLYLLHQVIGETALTPFGVWGYVSYKSISFVGILLFVSYYVYIYESKFRKWLLVKISTTLSI